MLRKVSYWFSLAASRRGARDANEDFVAIRTLQYGIWRAKVLVACDGVASRPEGGACSSAVGEAAIESIQGYFKRRKSVLTLDAGDIESLGKSLLSLPVEAVSPQSATTLAVALVYPRLLGRRWATLVFWAGDSRVYELDDSGTLHTLTKDHHDQEGRLTSYYGGDGKMKGTLSWVYRERSAPPSAVCVTTDGVHERCRPEEIRHFLLYCMSQQIDSDEQLSDELSEFLRLNISDNFSFVLYYRLVTEAHLRTVAADLEEE